MRGVIVSEENFTYEGDIVNKEPHGKGSFQYSNGDSYIGECKYGKLDGYGTYYFHDGGVYEGFFSYGKIDGIGTYTDPINVYKGTWRRDKKHGSFYKTNLPTGTTYKQMWLKGKLISSERVQYIQPAALRTTKDNPILKPKKYQATYRVEPRKCNGCSINTVDEKKCIACQENPRNATNTACGHISMCHVCLAKCDRCPICRVGIVSVLKLYIS